MDNQKISLIIKRIKDDAQHNKSSVPRSLAATIYYIDNAQAHGDKLLVIDNRSVQGCFGILADDDDRIAQRDEISANHRLYSGRGRKLDHFIISYSNELATKHTHEDFRADVKTLMHHMGMSEHACMYSAHRNTQNIHLHVVIDRVSLSVNKQGRFYIPVDVGTVKRTNKAGLVRRVDAFCQQAAMYEICVRRNYPTHNILYNEEGQRIRQPQYGKIAQTSLQEEKRTGFKSIQSHMQQIANDIFSLEKSWLEALKKLNAKGLKYVLRFDKNRNVLGAKLVGPKNNWLKSSALTEENSYKNLIKRWGEFPHTFEQNKAEADGLLPKITLNKALDILRPIFQAAVEQKIGWEKLEEILSNHQQKFTLVPSGGSFVVQFNGTDDKVKLSKIARQYSKKKLDAEFGVLANSQPSLTQHDETVGEGVTEPLSQSITNPRTQKIQNSSKKILKPRPSADHKVFFSRRRRAVKRALHHEQLAYIISKSFTSKEMQYESTEVGVSYWYVP